MYQAPWADYFVYVCMVETQNEQLPQAGLQMAAAKPPIKKIPPFMIRVTETVRRSNGGKGAGICNIIADMPIAKGKIYDS